MQNNMQEEEKVFNCYQELNMHIHEIEKICIANKIPILITYANPVTEEYANKVITPKFLGIEMEDDKISKLNVALNRNFSIKVKNNSPEAFTGDIVGSIIDEF